MPTRWSRGSSKLLTVGVKNLRARILCTNNSCWRPTSPVKFLPCVPALRPGRRRNLISYIVIFLTHGRISPPKLLCKRQRLACSYIKIKPKAYSPARCYYAKHHDWGWLLGCWHTAVFRDIIPKRYNLIILFVEDRINGESFIIGKNKDWMPVILQVIQYSGVPLQTFWAIAVLNRGFLKRLKLFHSIFLTILDTVETKIFFLCASFVILWPFLLVCQFCFSRASNAFLMACLKLKVFLIEDDPLGTLRTSNILSLDEQSFCWRSAALNLLFSWSSLVTNWIF